MHAKVGVVDDRWLTLGSANLNGHSFYNDCEVNLVTCDTELARDTRLRLWAAHLERDIDEIAGDPSTVVDEPGGRSRLSSASVATAASH